jgi:hypothetical protein
MSSKGYLAIWAGSALLALAGCDAGNQQQDPGAPATEDESSDNMAMYEPDDSTGGETGTAEDPTTADDPYSTTDPSMSSDDPLMGSDRSQQGESGMSSGQSLESMSPDQIVGKTVVSAEGEEIGEVQEIVQDPATSEKFAVVDVGGFLGVGQKSVTIGLNELQMSQGGEDRLESDLTRQTLETKTEYTPGEYEPVDQSSGQQTTQ